MQPFNGIDFSKSNRIVAAVSGGGDSLALLALLRDALTKPGSSELLVVTVDHGLRPESAAEAAHVGALCRDMGVAHRIMRWEVPTPTAGLQAKARAARYDLLAQAAREAGADMVLTGHTADDQLETLAMRAARGSGPGLAGIAPATFLFDRTCTTAGTWFVRPLLGLRRAGLRDYLSKRNLGWIDDPSNEDPRFERVRARRALKDADRARHETLLREQADAAAARTALDEAVARLIERHAREIAPGLVRLDAGLVEAADTEAGRRAIAVLLAFIGGTFVLPETGKTASWAARLGDAGRATLARCVAERRSDAVYLRRENRGVSVSRDGAVFDSRYGLCGGTAQDRRWSMPAPDDDADREPASDAPETLVRAAARLQPALGIDGEIRRVWQPPAGASWYRILNPWPAMVPLFDLASARAVARLAGAPDIPSPPLAKNSAGR